MANKKGRPKSAPPDMVICERIREARFVANLSQAKLAKAIGVTTDTVRNWEKGRALPATENTYQLIADICKVEKNWLMHKDIQDILQQSRDILKNFNIKEWTCITPNSLKEEARSYALIYALQMCGYKLEDIVDKKQYSDYMESSIKNSIEFYMNTLNRKEGE